MCQFLSSEVARLVLGYLEDTKCLKSYEAFLQESPNLDECRKMVSGGIKYRRGKETLLTILQDYCDLSSNANATSKSAKNHGSPPVHEKATSAQNNAISAQGNATVTRNNGTSAQNNAISAQGNATVTRNNGTSALDNATLTHENAISAQGNATVTRNNGTSALDNATLTHENATSARENVAVSDSAFKTPDKNNYYSLRRHNIRQRNLSKQFLSSPTAYGIGRVGSPARTAQGKRSSTDPTVSLRSPIVDADSSPRSSRSAETVKNPAPSLKDSQNVGPVVRNGAKHILFEGENRPGTIKAVYLHSPVRKDIFGRKSISVASKRIDISPVAARKSGKSLAYDNGFHTSDKRMVIAEKRIHVQEDNSDIDGTPRKDGNSISSNINYDEVDRCRTVCAKQNTINVCEHDRERQDRVLVRTTTSSPSARQAKNALCRITEVETMETCAVGSGPCTPEVSSVVTTSVVSSAIANKNITISRTSNTSTPEYSGNPPAYTTCPTSVDSPRYILSDERLLQAPILTPMKDMYDLRCDDGKSPKRKSIIPRRRVMSENSPGPKQSPLIEIMNFSNMAVDDTVDPLASLEELFNVSMFAERIADTINKVKSLDRPPDFAPDPINSSKSDNDSTTQGNSNKLINEIIKHSDVTLEEMLISLSDKLEHSRDHTSNSHLNSNLLSPINFAAYEQPEDIPRLDALAEPAEHIMNNVHHTQMQNQDQNQNPPLPSSHIVQSSETPMPETADMIHESAVRNEQTCSDGLLEVSKRTINEEQHKLDSSIPPSIQREILTSDTPANVMDDVGSKDADLEEGKLDMLTHTEETSALVDLTSDGESIGSASSLPGSGINAQNMNLRGKRGRGKRGRFRKPVAKQSSDILNQAVMETINCEPSSKNKNVIPENKPPDVSQTSSTFTASSETARNNTLTYMYSIPSMQNTQQTYLLVYSNMLSTAGNVIPGYVAAPAAQSASLAIPPATKPVPFGISPAVQPSSVVIPSVQPSSVVLPTVQPVSAAIPLAAQPACVTVNSGINLKATFAPSQIGPTTPPRKSKPSSERTLRRNLFDSIKPVRQNRNLTLSTEAADNELNKSKSHLQIYQNNLPSGSQKVLDMAENVPVLSIPSPHPSLPDCEKLPALVRMSTRSSQNPKTLLVSPPNTRLSKNLQTVISQSSCNQDVTRDNIDAAGSPVKTSTQQNNLSKNSLTPVKVNMFQDGPTFQFLTLSPGHPQGQRQSYIGGCKLSTILPKVPGLDLSKQEQIGEETKRRGRKRKRTVDEESRPKQGRPRKSTKKKQKPLFQSSAEERDKEAERTSPNNRITLKPPVDEDSRSARDLFAEIIGCNRKELETPRRDRQSQSLKALISSARKVVGTNNRTRRSHVRTLNFSPKKVELERVSPRTKKTVPRARTKKTIPRARTKKLNNSGSEYRKKSPRFRQKKSPRCRKVNVKFRPRGSTSRSYDPNDSSNEDCDDPDRGCDDDSVDKSHLSSTEIITLPENDEQNVTPKKFTHSKGHEWSQIHVDDSPVYRSSVQGDSSVKQVATPIMPSDSRTKGSSVLSSVGTLRRTPAARKLSSSSDDLNDTNGSVKQKLILPHSDENGQNEENCVDNVIYHDVGDPEKSPCTYFVDGRLSPNVITPSTSTDAVSEEVDVIPVGTNCNFTVRNCSETKKVAAKDNPNLPAGVKVPKKWNKSDITSYSSTIASQKRTKPTKRKKPPSSVSPIGKVSTIHALNSLTLTALNERNHARKKKNSTCKPGVKVATHSSRTKYPGRSFGVTAKESSVTDCDKVLRFRIGGKELTHTISRKEISSTPCSILKQQNADAKCELNTTYMGVETEVVIDCESQGSSPEQVHQKKKLCQAKEFQSEYTTEVDEAVASITLQSERNDGGENELESVKAFVNKELQNQFSENDDSTLQTQTVADSRGENSSSLTPKKSPAHLKNGQKSNCENATEVEEATTVSEDGENELNNVKAFIAQGMSTVSVEHNSMQEVQTPLASYEDSSILATPGKGLTNVTSCGSSAIKGSKRTPTRKTIPKDAGSCELNSGTSKAPNFQIDINFEVAETLASMNELSNISLEGGSSLLQTPGKSLMNAPSPPNTKSGDPFLNLKTMSVDYLLGLVHNED